MLTTKEQIAAAGLANERSGNLVLLAAPDAWLAHDWWLSDAEKPQWQFGVDIHSKPGFDTRELFFDPARKCIAQDPHGMTLREIVRGTNLAPSTAHRLLTTLQSEGFVQFKPEASRWLVGHGAHLVGVAFLAQ